MKMTLNLLLLTVLFYTTVAIADDVFNMAPPPPPKLSPNETPPLVLKSPEDYAEIMRANEIAKNDAIAKQQVEDAKRSKEKVSEMMAQTYQDNLQKNLPSSSAAKPVTKSLPPPFEEQPTTSPDSVSNLEEQPLPPSPAPEEKPTPKNPAPQGFGITY